MVTVQFDKKKGKKLTPFSYQTLQKIQLKKLFALKTQKKTFL